MKVLVADDDRLIRFALENTLSEAGYVPLCAADGLAAVELLETERPVLLVLDIAMPVMSGYAVLAWLQEHETFRHLPVIILSGYVVEAEEFAQYPQVVEVLQKPLYVDTLLTAVQQCAPRLPVPFSRAAESVFPCLRTAPLAV